MNNLRYIAVTLCVAAMLFSCTSKSKTKTILEIATRDNSSEPSLHKSKDGTIFLSWIETDSLKQNKLFFSKLVNDRWTDSKLIAKGDNWFVNWADFPALSTFGKDNLVAHYLEKSASGTYTYDVKLTISNDNGETWQKGFKPHTDHTESEHGFVSKIAISDRIFMNVWLDGRQFAYAEKDTTIQKEMTLRAAKINVNGKILEEFLIDNRVCDCCQTDMAMTPDGPMLVYRDRSNKEIRDTYFSLFSNGKWSTPKAVSNDGWIIAGCPVNGPAISSKKETTVATWFTMQEGMSKVKTAFYNSTSNRFDAPILLDFIDPLGRLDIEVVDADSALISWVDSVDNQTKIQLQRVYQDGTRSEIFSVSSTSPKRSSGFPRMVIKEGNVYLAWTDSNNGSLQVKTVKVNLKDIKYKS